MHIHIIGICGTFMGGIAALAKQKSHRVTGSDKHAYPPMSTQLTALDIEVFSGFSENNLGTPDLVVVGNVVSRGNPEFEAVLDRGLPYISGPQWLAEFVLKDRHVLAVAGTHGKTTTTSMLAFILEKAGLKPGYLIGGVANGFDCSASLGEGKYFVIEADEYDSALFDKRAKFIHYRPNTLILNNLEYDHADIFKSLSEIETQFQYLIRTIPQTGQLIVNAKEENLARVLAKGCWTPIIPFNDTTAWHAKNMTPDGSAFDVYFQQHHYGHLAWAQLGLHNVQNAIAAIAAAQQIGVEPGVAIDALTHFPGVKRRLEVIGRTRGVTIYDDFAHHPTAIKTTLNSLRAHVGKQRIIAVLDFGSYTMRSGLHAPARLMASLENADVLMLCSANISPDFLALLDAEQRDHFYHHQEIAKLVEKIAEIAQTNDHVLIMSNTAFGGLHRLLLDTLGH
jgi:UDP-N-acetylmuramate: L-alanyl-gamma-D-glutamyl-meso-diaminopimelate ligase